jgi:hypothetical protein
LLAELARILLDPHVADDQVRHRVWAQVPRERLAAAVETTSGWCGRPTAATSGTWLAATVTSDLVHRRC